MTLLYDATVSILPYAAVAAGSWCIYKLLVAPYLSPLRKIPGRPYRPIVGNMLEALEAEAMDNAINWMKEYKSRIVRFYFLYGECRVLIADPDLIRQVMVTNSKNYLKPNNSGLNALTPEFIILLDGDKHHALRRFMNPVFNTSSTNGFIPIFQECARKVAQLWQEEIGKCDGKQATLVAQEYMTRVTLEAICRCGFDFNINSIEDPNGAGVKSFNRTLSTLQIKLSNMLPFQGLFPTKANRQIRADMEFFHKTIRSMIDEKKSKLMEGHTSNDLLSRLLQAKDDHGNTISDDCLFGQVGGFLFAGFETTSMNLTWTLLLLAQHPDVQERVRQEVKQVIPDPNQPISVEHLDSLKYLTAVIRESLRLYPPASIVFRRAAKADTLGGYHIPAGTLVGVSIGALHRLSENWDDPLTFRPERFLAPSDQWIHKFLPFNTGPYMCIGHIFSLTETKVTLALLIRNFHIALPDGYKFRRSRQLTLQPKPPLSLRIRPL